MYITLKEWEWPGDVAKMNVACECVYTVRSTLYVNWDNNHTMPCGPGEQAACCCRKHMTLCFSVQCANLSHHRNNIII